LRVIIRLRLLNIQTYKGLKHQIGLNVTGFDAVLSISFLSGKIKLLTEILVLSLKKVKIVSIASSGGAFGANTLAHAANLVLSLAIHRQKKDLFTVEHQKTKGIRRPCRRIYRSRI